MSSLDEAAVAALEAKAKLLRRHVVREIHNCGKGHYGGSLSAVDIITALYFHVLRLDPTNPQWPDRDRFILSKGHAASALYAALAERGFFPVDELLTYKLPGSRLQGHPDMNKTPGVELTAGPLGEGLSVAFGMALAGRLEKRPYRVYVLLSDGELNAGMTWEAVMAIGHHRLDTITAIVDVNGLQVDGPTRGIINTEPLADKWRACRWDTREIDGHNMREIVGALTDVASVRGHPQVVLARTTKGKGVSFMENVTEWHSAEMTAEQYQQALAELGEAQGG